MDRFPGYPTYLLVKRSGWHRKDHSCRNSSTKAWIFYSELLLIKGWGDTGHARKNFTSIAVQLADRSPILRRYICDAIEECSNISSLSLHDQWRYLILTPLSRLEKSFQGLSMLLVIDALDECDDEKCIMAFVNLVVEARSLGTIPC